MNSSILFCEKKAMRIQTLESLRPENVGRDAEDFTVVALTISFDVLNGVIERHHSTTGQRSKGYNCSRHHDFRAV